MDIVRGTGGKPRNAAKNPTRARTSFNWASHRMQMANYLRDNYTSYKSTGRKIEFLRKMRLELNIGCNDEKKLQNAFADLLKRYTDVKAKLNSSGFGVDPEKDATLSLGWIKKQCPYFEILDEVMGCRPNVTPPAVVSTSAMANTENDCDRVMNDADDKSETDMDLGNEAVTSDCENDAPSSDGAVNNETPENSQSQHPGVEKYVKQAFSGLKPVKSRAKDPVGVFAEILTERMQINADSEKEKIKLEDIRHQDDIKVRKERNEIELLKVNSQKEIEQQKLQLEKEKLADKAAEREHELLKIRMEQEFELKKLELQLSQKN